MPYRIKNWEKFQHYKSGRGAPPWIKLYRGILNDKEWFALDPAAAKFLVSLWVLAAETDGELPDSETIAFRLRLASKDVSKFITLCSHWIITDASKLLADCYQVATPETETETETETSSSKLDGFADFWLAYPKKVGKGAAEKAFAKARLNGHLPDVLKAIEVQKRSEQWQKDGGQFVPNPATWLNQKRWEDGEPAKVEKDWI